MKLRIRLDTIGNFLPFHQNLLTFYYQQYRHRDVPSMTPSPFCLDLLRAQSLQILLHVLLLNKILQPRLLPIPNFTVKSYYFLYLLKTYDYHFQLQFCWFMGYHVNNMIISSLTYPFLVQLKSL